MSESEPTLVKNPAKVVVVHPERSAALILHLEAEERRKRGIDEWHLPGGCFETDKDQTLEDTAHREVSEETGGLQIRILGTLGTAGWDAYYEGEPAHFEATFFQAEALPDEATGRIPDIQTSQESDAAAWVSVRQLNDYPGLTTEARRYITQALTGADHA